ncbi:ATP-binding protein [Embleya sp. NPDC050154]|uniref:ATP-binding protein n=1 Tax=unclassified Embleya TaxID=2699296 RepID=UPI00378781D8
MAADFELRSGDSSPHDARRSPARGPRSITLTGVGAAAAARRAAREFLAQSPGAAPGLADTVELVVSELVTNAIRHATGPCRLELAHVDRGVRVSVHDDAHAAPTPRDHGPLRVGGHGLELVRALSTDLVVTATATGKTVTAHIRAPDTPPPG